MTDFQPPSTNVFDQQDPNENTISYRPKDAAPAQANLFDDADYGLGQEQTSAGGAFVRGAERGVLPAVGGIAGAAAGAETGAAAGGAIGSLFGGVGAAPGAVVGGVAGGLIGAFGGSAATGAAQDYALSKAPDSWRESIGQDDRQQQLDQQFHPTASFLGGLAPYAVTLKPGWSAAKMLPENATALQRIMANPATAHVFGGLTMGGVELGQEYAEGNVDWRNVAIATAFGVVLNKPNRFGEAISDMGGRTARRPLGLPEPTPGVEPPAPEPVAAPEQEAEPTEENLGARRPYVGDLEPFSPYDHQLHDAMLRPATLAEADDLSVMGLGADNYTFQGESERNYETSIAAWNTRGDEMKALGQVPKPDLDLVARRIDPEAFREFDALTAQKQAMQTQISRYHAPSDADVAALNSQKSALQDALQSAVDARHGHQTGSPELRRLRAQIRDVESQQQALSERGEQFRSGLAVETPELSALRQRLVDADTQLRDLNTYARIRAAREKASEHLGSEVVEPSPVSLQDIRRGATLLPSEEPGGEAPTTGTSKAPPYAAEPVHAEPSMQQQVTPTPAPVQAPIATPKPVEQQLGEISNRVAGQLVNAGVPADQAEAAGHIQAAIFNARAKWFGGARGTPEELFKAEGPIIKRGETAPASHLASEPPKAPAGPPPQTMRGFVRANGYIAERDRGQFSSNVPKDLFRKGGLSADEMRRKAAEQGYIGGANSSEAMEKTFVQDLANALENPRHYSVHDQARIDETETKKRLAAEAEAHAQSGVAHPEDEFDRLSSWASAPIEGEQGLELFQGARPRASISFQKGKQPLLRVFAEQNASSIIHESGHQMLEQLMADSRHAQAPEQLRSDADTVRRSLGIKADQARPNRAQHEQFAKWFEQYMREGVAPSPRLAKVFAQFKEWLMQVYKSVRDLGVPITDDIRGVFDRLLDSEPDHTLVSRETGRQPSLADIHEVDAHLTEHREAAAAHDRVVSEANQHLEDQPQEVKDEIAAIYGGGAPSGEGKASAGLAGEVVPAIVGPESLSANKSAGGEHGPVESGGAKAGAEGAGVSGGERAGAGSAGAGSSNAGNGSGAAQYASKPRDEFGAKSNGLDKAGNIRIENLTSVEDLAHWIRDSAAENDQFRAVRGPMTDGQLVDLADTMGLKPEDINKQTMANLLGGFDNLAPKVLAARVTVVRSAQAVSDAMAAVDPRDAKTVAAFAEAVARHDMITTGLSQATAETGRALRAFRSLLTGWGGAQDVNQFLKENTGRTFYQLVQMAKMGKTLDTPGKVSKFLRDAQKRSYGGMVLEYWINGLISGPATHMTYTVGNNILAAENALVETPVAAGIGRILNALGRVERQAEHPGELALPPTGASNPRVLLGETTEKVKAYFRGHPAAIEAALEALRSGMTTQLPGEISRPQLPFSGDTSLVLPNRATNAEVSWRDVQQQTFGMIQGVKDGLHAGAELVRAGGVEGAPLWGVGYSPLGQIPDVQYRGVTVLPTGQIARLPSRMVAAIHSYFRSLNYSMEKSALAYRQAVNEGVTGDALAKRVAEIRVNPDEGLMTQARGVATDLTLMGEGGALTKTLTKLTNIEFPVPFLGQTKLLKFIDPFIHIAANVIDQSVIQRTPAGILSKGIRDDLMGKNGNIAQDTAAARMLAGSVLSLTFGSLAAQGVITGSGPSDPHKAAMWRLAGYQAHSVRIGDMFYDAHRLGSMGMLMGVSADLYDVAHTMASGDMLTAASMLQHAITQNILDESFMRGPSDLINAIDNPSTQGEKYITNFLSSFTPYSTLTRQWDRATDPYSRSARNVMDGVKKNIPGLSEQLFPNVDVWGTPMPNPDALIHAGITAVYERQMSRDPVNIAMVQLGIGPAPVERTIRNVKLNDEQYDAYARIAGRMSKMRLDAIVNSADWATYPNYIKQNVITEVLRQSRESARGLMLMKWPSIAEQSVQLKRVKEGLQ